MHTSLLIFLLTFLNRLSIFRSRTVRCSYRISQTCLFDQDSYMCLTTISITNGQQYVTRYPCAHLCMSYLYVCTQSCACACACECACECALMCVRACVRASLNACVRVRACVRACVRPRVRASVRARACVRVCMGVYVCCVLGSFRLTLIPESDPCIFPMSYSAFHQYWLG